MKAKTNSTSSDSGSNGGLTVVSWSEKWNFLKHKRNRSTETSIRVPSTDITAGGRGDHHAETSDRVKSKLQSKDDHDGPHQWQVCREITRFQSWRHRQLDLSLCLLPLPVRWLGWKELGLFGGGGGWPFLWAVLLALAEGGWYELEREMPSEAGRGRQGGSCGLRGAGRRSPWDFLVLEYLSWPARLQSSSSSSSLYATNLAVNSESGERTWVLR